VPVTTKFKSPKRSDDMPMIYVKAKEGRRAYFEGKATVAILSGDALITEDGAVPSVNPRNTGGWAQFGSCSE